VLDVCDAVGTFIEWWGFKSIHGRIWALLALRSEPTSQADLAQLLGVSRALISVAIGELTNYGLVVAVSEHRNTPYLARWNFWPTITDVLRSREWMIIEEVRVALDAAVDEADFVVERDVKLPSPYDLAKLRLLLRITEMAQTMLKMLMALGGARMPSGFGRFLTQAVRLAAGMREH